MNCETAFRMSDACPCGVCQLADEHCNGCDSYDEWITRRVDTLNPDNAIQCNFGNSCSSGRAIIIIAGFRGKLNSQYDSNKWENPWWNRSTERSWKKDRINQYLK